MFVFFLFFFFYESLCCKYSKDTQNSRVIANINVFQLRLVYICTDIHLSCVYSYISNITIINKAQNRKKIFLLIICNTHDNLWVVGREQRMRDI